MEWLKYLFNGIEIVFIILTGINVIYLFVFAVASLFRIQIHWENDAPCKRIAVLIPGYKEDRVIVDVVADALMQDYPQDKYDVVVIADSFNDKTLSLLKEFPIKIIEVVFDNSTKARSLNKAMSVLPDNYDIAVILDADNLMEKKFLSRINNFFAGQTAVAVQGHRIAKNMNTSFAILDTISEEINNQIFRKGHRILGFSSAIIGSGVAFDYNYFKKMITQIHAVGGYDKELEIKILRERQKIYYLPDALVYDEKVQTANAFSNQRRRWLSSQIHHVRMAFVDALKKLFTEGNLDYFDKVFQWLLLPRVIILSVMFTFVPLFIILEQFVFNSYLTTGWVILFMICSISFMIAVPRRFYNIHTLKALKHIPQGVFLMFRNFFTLKGANKTFIHTVHGEPDSSNVNES
jgi:cellulose synthase/poly-beta-1,6-N-acetylglucosamine synthase-like glycosyltransferase